MPNFFVLRIDFLEKMHANKQHFPLVLVNMFHYNLEQASASMSRTVLGTLDKVDSQRAAAVLKSVEGRPSGTIPKFSRFRNLLAPRPARIVPVTASYPVMPLPPLRPQLPTSSPRVEVHQEEALTAALPLLSHNPDDLKRAVAAASVVSSSITSCSIEVVGQREAVSESAASLLDLSILDSPRPTVLSPEDTPLPDSPRPVMIPYSESEAYIASTASTPSITRAMTVEFNESPLSRSFLEADFDSFDSVSSTRSSSLSGSFSASGDAAALDGPQTPDTCPDVTELPPYLAPALESQTKASGPVQTHLDFFAVSEYPVAEERRSRGMLSSLGSKAFHKGPKNGFITIFPHINAPMSGISVTTITADNVVKKRIEVSRAFPQKPWAVPSVMLKAKTTYKDLVASYQQMGSRARYAISHLPKSEFPKNYANEILNLLEEDRRSARQKALPQTRGVFTEVFSICPYTDFLKEKNSRRKIKAFYEKKLELLEAYSYISIMAEKAMPFVDEAFNRFESSIRFWAENEIYECERQQAAYILHKVTQFFEIKKEGFQEVISSFQLAFEILHEILYKVLEDDVFTYTEKVHNTFAAMSRHPKVDLSDDLLDEESIEAEGFICMLLACEESLLPRLFLTNSTYGGRLEMPSELCGVLDCINCPALLRLAGLFIQEKTKRVNPVALLRSSSELSKVHEVAISSISRFTLVERLVAQCQVRVDI